MSATKTTWTRIDPALRAELEALVGSRGDAWLSTYLDTMAWWLLLMLVCIGGAGTCIWYFATEQSGFFGFLEYARGPLDILRAVVLEPARIGLLAAIIVGAWTARTWIGNHNRRGFAATKDAIVLVRGPKLVVIPRAEIESTSSRQVAPGSHRGFTAVRLTLRGGRTKELFVHRRWAKAAFPDELK